MDTYKEEIYIDEKSFTKEKLRYITAKATNKKSNILVFVGKGSCYGKEIPIACFYSILTGTPIELYYFDKESVSSSLYKNLKLGNSYTTGFFNPSRKTRFFCIERLNEGKGNVFDKTMLLLNMTSKGASSDFIPMYFSEDERKYMIKLLYEKLL